MSNKKITQHIITDEALHAQAAIPYQEFLELKQELLEKQRAMEERLWLDSNLSKFDEVIRLNYDKDMATFAEVILEYLSQIIQAVHGAFFVVDNDEEVITAVAGYACTVKTMEKSRFLFGEGLVGQAVKSQKLINVDNIPTRLDSSLAHLSNASLVVSPFIFNQMVYGVLELTTLERLPNKYIDLINRCSQSLATALQSIINNQKTKTLLQESMQQSEELRTQSEEIRQNLEELQAIQEDMHRKELELTGLVQALDSTLAMIEFDLSGHILNANQKFLEVMDYNISEIKGKHHRMFVETNYAKSEEYKEFWEKLGRGVPQISSEFQRYGRNGKEVWLTASYTPVIDNNGDPYKIVKLAIDVSERKKALFDFENQMEAIDKSFAVIEFALDSTILKANDNFLNTVGYQLDEVVGKKHRIFVTPEHAESETYQNLWDNLRKGEFQRGEFPRIHKNGKEIWISGSYNPIFDSNGKLYKIVKFVVDITHLKEKTNKKSPVAID
ncbi:MAG TPA: hypothetical protein DCM08_04690 [Microscillaceae bacterium]|jgi:methyl-accepting chemotaxis protein|nr:hypothetical protein [Microscillaceae bacterium]